MGGRARPFPIRAWKASFRSFLILRITDAARDDYLCNYHGKALIEFMIRGSSLAFRVTFEKQNKGLKASITSGSRVCVSCRMALDTKTAVEMMKEKEDHNRKMEAKLLEVQESQRKDHETMERVLALLEKAQSSKERRPPSGVG